MPIYVFFFTMFGLLSAVTGVAIARAAPADVGTGFTPGMYSGSFGYTAPHSAGVMAYDNRVDTISYSNSSKGYWYRGV